MAKIIDGRALAKEMREEIREEAEAFTAETGVKPGLATVLLPSLNPEHKVFFDGRDCDLELPVVR